MLLFFSGEEGDGKACQGGPGLQNLQVIGWIQLLYKLAIRPMQIAGYRLFLFEKWLGDCPMADLNMAEKALSLV